MAGNFYSVVTDAINDLIVYGFDSRERLQGWLRKIEEAARVQLIPQETLVRSLQDLLIRVFHRMTNASAMLRRHVGLERYTLEHIQPKLRAELDRRILASADLIKLNREASIQRTLQRFAGWATSIPVGGTEVAKRKEVKENIRRGIAGLPFEERRVVIDQGRKLSAAINEIVAVDGGAIAARWVSHWRETGYDFRPEHKALDDKLFVVRHNWALQDGLMKLDGHSYTDEIEQPAQLPYCRCYWQFVYALRLLPSTMLTAKGHAALSNARLTIAA